MTSQGRTRTQIHDAAELERALSADEPVQIVLHRAEELSEAASTAIAHAKAKLGRALIFNLELTGADNLDAWASLGQNCGITEELGAGGGGGDPGGQASLLFCFIA